ncbi:MAG: hypothetical protein PHX62_07200, partial [Bacilli bacterium]|nr:hypothetical protein [Bacilli bacterium]
MQLNNQLETYIIISPDLVFEMLPSGDVYQIKYQNENISMYHANSLEGMLMNIYLRVNGRHYTKLLGVNSPSGFKMGKNQMQYFGEFENVRYQVDFKLINLTWFWLIKLNSEDPNLVVEVFYGQDVSLNNGAVNEAYTCQYLDHQVLKDEIGYHLQTKQNQGLKLLLQQGALTETCAYATDGFDFFGKEYKLNNQIKFLKEGSLPSRIYQYEFAYISLQTPKIQLDEPQEIGFYACLTPDYQETKCRWQTRAEIKSQYLLIIDEEDFQEFPKIHLAISGENTYPYLPFSEAELEEFFPKKVFQEEADNLLLSWFTETGTHFVTGAKEAYLERAQGNIIANNGMREIEKPAICSTNYIFGVFNSQICLGNTQFHKMISRNQTPLNILKFSGQRIFLKYQGIYRLLTIPAVYEMNINSSAWYYKVDDDILKIEVGIPVEDNLVRLEFSSKQRRSYDLILCQELVMGEFVGRHPLQLKVDGEFVEFYFDETTMAHHYYPDYYFKSKIETEGSYQYVGDEIFYEDGKGRGNPLFGLLLKGSEFSYTIYGVGGQKTFPSLSIEEIKKEYQKVHQNNCNNFKLEIDSNNPTYLEIQKFNLLVPWYVHNALIHYSMPHGLEQYSGGAWGTRDICQGPAELFMAFGRYDLLKSIILKVYERQFHESGDWPQWFMFDNYGYIQADSSHGDIIVWPLYLLSKYLLETADKEILKIKVPYTTKA